MERKLLQKRFWQNAGASLLLFFLCQFTFGQQRVSICNDANITKYKDIQVRAVGNCNGVIRWTITVNGRSLLSYYNGVSCPNYERTLYIGTVNGPMNFSARHDSGSGSRPWNPIFYGNCSGMSFDDNQTGRREAYIYITGVLKNEAPVGNNDSYTKSVCPEQNVKLNVLANDSDKENDTLTINRINTQPSNGTATIVDGGKNISYAPNSGFDGTDSFTYIVCDSQGGCSSPVNVQINVNGNAAPILSKTSLENTCPVSSVNLRNIHSGTTPSGTTLVFSKDNDPSDGLSSKLSTDASKAVKQSGTYYAYYENNSANCYSLGKAITVKINNCNAIPRITNNGGKETNSLSVVENFKGDVIDMNAKDDDGETENGGGLIWSFAGGADVSDFTLNKQSGIVKFKSSPNFENPHDKDKNNIYEVNLKVTDSKGASDEQLLKIKVTNVLECIEGSFGDECDEDKDGVINRDDLDDDNDGILDTQEISVYGENAVQAGGALYPERANGISDNKFSILGKGDFVSLQLTEKLDKGTLFTIYWMKGHGKSRIRVDYSSDGKNYSNLSPSLNLSKIKVVLPYNLRIPKNGVTHIRVRRIGAGSVGLDAITVPKGDFDKDNIPDQYDTDSDNDGCADALEADANFKESDIDGDLRLKGDIDSKGVPKVAGSKGQLPLTTYDATEKSSVCNEAPEITNNGGADTNELDYKENQTNAVVDMNATDADGDTEGNGLTWDISGGVDQNSFEINSDTGDLSFKTSPDYEKPTDANKDNTYVVELRVTDSATAIDTQTLTVKVLNTLECTTPLKTGPECDFDDDGVINKDDLDDDNDGILDTKEISVYGENSTQRGVVKYADRSTNIPDGKFAILGKGGFVTVKLNKVLKKGDFANIYWMKSHSKGRIRVDYSSNGKDFTHLTKNIGITGKKVIQARRVYIPKDRVTHIRVRRVGAGNIGLDAIVVASNDKDNDGFLDQFDADSDGDGCFDALESGGVDANNDGVLDGTGISSKGLVTGGKGGYNGGTKTVLEYNGIEIKVDESSLQNKKVNATTGLELFVTGEASIATSYENGVPVYGTKGNANETLNYQWYIEESGSLNKLSNNTIYEGVTTAKLTIKEDLAVADYKYVLQVTNKEQSCFEESYDVKVSVSCEINSEAVEVVGVSPTTCIPANDGSIAISKANLQANTAYKVTYTKQGESAQEKELTTDADGKIIITDLVAGTYSEISISSLSNPSCNYTHSSEVVVPEKDLSYFGLSTSKTDETYVKAKDGVIIVNVSGLSAFEVIVTNEANQIMPRVSDFRYISLQPGLYKVKVVETATGCEQSIMVEIKSALPPDFELGAQNIMATVSKDVIGKQPISFVLSIGEIANERSSPEPIRILIKKIPGFEINYDQLLTQLNGVRRLKNKEWTMSDHPSNYVLTYTPSIANDELRNEVQRIGITGTFDVKVSTNSGNINMTIRILSRSGGEQNNLNNFVDVPITIKKE